MTAPDNYLDRLRALPPAAREQEVRQKVTDALQELVACVERALAVPADAPHSCVIDDVQVVQTDIGPDGCRLLLRYTASARLYAQGDGDLERVAGKAEATLDAAGRLTYRGATFAAERDFVPPDLGGGD